VAEDEGAERQRLVGQLAVDLHPVNERQPGGGIPILDVAAHDSILWSSEVGVGASTPPGPAPGRRRACETSNRKISAACSSAAFLKSTTYRGLSRSSPRRPLRGGAQ